MLPACKALKMPFHLPETPKARDRVPAGQALELHVKFILSGQMMLSSVQKDRPYSRKNPERTLGPGLRTILKSRIALAGMTIFLRLGKVRRALEAFYEMRGTASPLCLPTPSLSVIPVEGGGGMIAVVFAIIVTHSRKRGSSVFVE